MKTLFIALALFSTSALALDDREAMIELGILSMFAADYAQTRQLVEHCNNGRIKESNPILGKCPSQGKIGAYFFTAAVSHLIVAQILPKDELRLFWAATFGVEINALASNYSLGLNISF